jgi:hypothetical protein
LNNEEQINYNLINEDQISEGLLYLREHSTI